VNSSFERLSSRAPLSLTPSGALQLGGLVRGGALLISSTDVYAWGAANTAGAEADILNFLDTHERQRGEFLLLGTGSALAFPPPAFRAEIDRRGLGLETMDTSAACRTYNVLVAEARMFTAALLPLANPAKAGDLRLFAGR
jgi:uncharacterized protein